MTYILVDTANTFFRARHVVRGDLDTKVGMAFHITLGSIKKAWHDFEGAHVVFCLEGRSWRKDFYEPYKRNRSDARAAQTEQQQEEDKVFWEMFDEWKDFVTNKTNCSVLHHPDLEADDLIAGWVQAHPNDNHVIISTDGDFAQLIAPNVKQFNGIQDVTTTHEGYFDDKGKRVLDKKTKEELEDAVNLWCSKKTEAIKMYSHISTWNTSLITDMSELFENKDFFNDNIKYCYTLNV